MATKRKRASAKSEAVDLTIHERVATLEVLVQSQAVTCKQIASSLEGIKADLNKYQGFWGAVTLIASAIWATFVLFKDSIVGWFTPGAK